MKLCRTCNEVKAFSEFRKDRTRPDGLMLVCKSCKKVYRNKNQCIAVDCEKPIRSRELCKNHYYKLRTYGDPNYSKPVEKCLACDLDARIKGYCNRHYTRVRTRGTVESGVRSATGKCLKCSKDSKYVFCSISCRSYDSYLKAKYGIDMEEYNRLHAQQEGKCAICLKPNDNLWVDHCHAGGQVRGLLCPKCNSLLGQADDDIAVLARAQQYLCAQLNLLDVTFW